MGHGGPPGRHGDRAGPHRATRQPSPRADVLRPRHAPGGGHRGAPDAGDDGQGAVQRRGAHGGLGRRRTRHRRHRGRLGRRQRRARIGAADRRERTARRRPSPVPAAATSSVRPARWRADHAGTGRRHDRPRTWPSASPRLARRRPSPARTSPACTPRCRWPGGRRPGPAPRRPRVTHSRAPPTSPSCGPARSPAAVRPWPSPPRGSRHVAHLRRSADRRGRRRRRGHRDGLAAPAVSLVGGVDLVQRDLLGERVLGLPRPPAP